MKLLFITFFSFSLFAGTIEEKEILRTSDVTSIFPAFDINKELNRAWISISTCENYSEDSFCDDTRIKLEELSLINNQIVYTKNSTSVVCAEVTTKGKGFFKHDVISETGNCSFYTEYDKKKIDDGFHQYTRRYNVLFLKVVAP